MVRFQNLHPLVLFVVLSSRLSGTEVEVTFEGTVIGNGIPGITRGDPARGRIIYDNATPPFAVSADEREYPAMLLFELRVGTNEFALTNGPGIVEIVDDSPSPNWLHFAVRADQLAGPAMGGFTPHSFSFLLIGKSKSTVPSLDLGSVATTYSLGEFEAGLAPATMSLMFDRADGTLWGGVGIELTRLEAAPLVRSSSSPHHFIRLEDIVAGGDGSGTAPAANVGIDPSTGIFRTAYFEGLITDSDGVNPSPVPESPFIDSVFLMKGQVPTAQDGCNGCFIQRTTRSGVALLVDDSEETNFGWNYILKDRAGGVSSPGIRVASRDYFTTAIGLHASAGITFDLDALRARHGEAAVGCFSCYWGMDDCGIGLVRLYAMVSNDDEGVTDIRNAIYWAGVGEPITIPIPRSAQYLTLASASVDGNMNCDHGTIARPIITPAFCPQNSDGWIWKFNPSRVAPQGERVIVEGEALFDGYSIRVGGVDLFDQTYLSDERRSGRTPSLPPGIYDADIVWDGLVIQRLPRAIEVAPPPMITAVTPDKALADRRTPARFQGKNLRPDMQVVLPNSIAGSEPLSRQEFHSPELITGLISPVDPLHAISGTNVFLFDQDRLYEFPVPLLYVDLGIEKVEPNLVLTTGGSSVTFAGLGFEPGMIFRIGAFQLHDVQVLDSNRARAKTPPLPAGLYSAELLLSDGTLMYTLPEAAQALPPPSPTITGVLPLKVSTRGGDVLGVTTDTWHGGAIPRIGGRSLSNVDGTQPNLLRGETPPLAPGLHTVELVGAGGAIVSQIENAIEAVDPADIQITSVAPFEVAVNGGTPVTLTGIGFEPGILPRLGGLALTQVEFIDEQHLRGLSPPLAEGTYDASITEGEAERARLDDAVHARPIALPALPALGRPPAQKVAAGNDRIAIAAAGIPAAAVLRIGGVPVTPVAPLSPCAVVGGAAGGGAIAGDGGHAVFEGMVPALSPGRYAVDFYIPGQGILATLDEAVEVVASNAPPSASHVVSMDVLADGSTRLHIFGSGFGASTTFRIGGAALVGAVVVSPRLAVGYAPALGPVEALGPRNLDVLDPRGNSVLGSAVVYVAPKNPDRVRFVRGDPNESGDIDLSDVISILGYLFLGSPTRLDCADAADIDDGGEINITDAIRLLGHLFLGGVAPAAPFPACGLAAEASGEDCERFAACAAGGGGGVVDGLRPRVFVLPESRTSPGEPILRDVSPVSGEVVVDDPPGGVDLTPGDIIAGYVPVTSSAIHESVTFLVKLEAPRSRSCLATAATDRTYAASPAPLADVFNDAAIEFEMPNTAADLRLSSDAVVATGNTRCDLAEQAAGGAAGSGATGNGGAGGGEARPGGGAQFGPLIDVDFYGLPVFDWEDRPNYIHVGFHRLRVLYANSEASLGVGISNGGLTGVSFFSGILLDAEIEAYVDSHFELHEKKERKLLSLRKDHLIVVYGVPIHFAATGDLYAGVDFDAKVNLYVDAGAKAHFKAGAGFRFDGERIHNLSGFDPPSLEKIPGTPDLNLSGAVVVKGYVRPETHFFAGILFRGLTADLGVTSEAFVRFHASGKTDPVPCFDWGVDAGMRVTMSPEFQLFGFDLWDPPPFDLINHEKLNLLGERYGCKFPPVAIVRHDLKPLGDDRYEVLLDASASYDPDRGPLRFRWDFDADGQCDRATLGDPRTSAVLEHACPPFDVKPFKGCLRGREMLLRVTDDENESVEHRFVVVLSAP